MNEAYQLYEQMYDMSILYLHISLQSTFLPLLVSPTLVSSIFVSIRNLTQIKGLIDCSYQIISYI